MENIHELPKNIIELELPFKISAGPGAGKTTWLVRHVQNVIKNSDRLDKTKKVACITYTRIGADTVNKKVKVETGTNRLDIGTIHSFLYRNVIKPFSFLIDKDNAGYSLFNISELHGHTDHIPSFSRISSWITTIGFKYSYLSKQVKDKNGLTNLDKSRSILSACDWVINGDDLKYIPRNNYHRELRFPSTKLTEYKQTCWEKGIMHHEDVLYFTHYIFKNYPRVIELVSNKFPYLFLDEFQDTNPLQTWMVKKLATKGTVIGVIGDPAQSIFEFAGAQRKDFNEFDLPELVTYKKSDNFRSTKKIVSFLKELRDDIEQRPSDEAKYGQSVVIIVGEASSAVQYVKELGDNSYAVLCRYNKDVSRLRYSTQNVHGDNLISALYSEDSNNQRPRFIHSLLKAYDFFEHEEYKEAIKEINKHLRGAKIDGMEKRKLAISIIEYLHENLDEKIIDIYHYLKEELKGYQVELTGIRKTKGKHKKSYLEKFKDFIPFVSKQTKINNPIRTIHQTKGDEFNNVLLCLFDKIDKNGGLQKSIEKIIDDYIVNSKTSIKLDTKVGEETRLVYVACSRAKKKLFINVPRLSDAEEVEMKKLGLTIERN
jgi:DNA helicase-2/ATP-dependent DNA helicase PcrA